MEDEQAKPELVCEQLRAASWAHFACHASADMQKLSASCLHLYGTTPDSGDLRLDAIESLSLQTLDMVVLSACWAGTPVVLPGNELVGLASAFLRSGVRRVVAPLWPVEDSMARSFMADFYAAAARLGPTLAMAAVQREWAESPDPDVALPANWAAYVVYGGCG